MNRKPTRVWYIIDNLHQGGAQHHLVELLSHLDRDRVSTRLICLQSDRPELAPRVRAMGVPLEMVGLPTCYGPSGMAWVLRTAVRLKQEQVAVVQTYLFGANTIGILAAWLAGVPVRIATRRGTGSSTVATRHTLANRVFARLATRVIAVADALRDQAIRQEGVPRNKVVTIHNGVDLGRFAPQDKRGAHRALGVAPTRQVVGVVANLMPWKGHSDLLAVAARLVRDQHDLHLLLVGDGPLRRTLEQSAEALGLSSRVTFAGRQDDVRPWIAAMDVLVQASTGEEGLSNAILEAMAMAKPVVASRYGGNPEVVTDGRTGWLFPPGDREALYQVLARTLEEPEQSEALGRAGRAVAETEFAVGRMVQRMTDLYHSELEGSERSVAFIIPNMEIGGAETDVVNLSRGLRSRDCSVAVVARGGRLLDELAKDGVACLKISVEGRSLLSIVRAAWQLAREAGREGWQILNAQSAYTTVIGALCRLFLPFQFRFQRPTLITTIHAIGRKEDTQVDAGYLRPVRWILQTLPQRVIFESYYEMGQLFGNRPPKHCQVIHNGVADRFFAVGEREREHTRRSLNLPMECLVIGIVAALIPLKGHRYFLEGAAYTIKEFTKARFLVVGEGPERVNLEEIARTLGLDGHVHFLGPRRDVADLLAALDVFVLASLRESFPLSIREAMAAGRPVVASNVGGVSELIRHGETGFLVPPGDSVALGLAMSRLLAEPRLRLRMGANGRLEAEQKYGMAYWMSKTESVFWGDHIKTGETTGGVQARL